MRNKIYLLLLAVLFVSQGLFAQHQKHTHPNGVSCGSDHLNNLYFQNNPEALQKRKAFDQKISTLKKTGMFNSVMSMNTQQIYEIPIVVHIAHLGEAEGTFYNPSDQQIINWVNYTNDVLSGTANGILGENNGGTNIPVRLVLAKRTENCEPTNGIVRFNASDVIGYAQHGVDNNNALGATGSEEAGASHQSIRNLSRWDPESYYNIYLVRNITGGVGGFAYFPGVSSDVDGSFMQTVVVGTSSTTFAHEMGHAFGLYHTFQGGDPDVLIESCPPVEDDCSLEGDMVCDTERAKSLNSYNWLNYPTNNDINPCTGVNYQGTQHNVMHYGAVRNRFTPGQKERALLQILEYRGNLLHSFGGQEPEEEVPNVMLAEMCIPESSQEPDFYMGPVKVTFGNILAITSGNDGITAHYYNYANSCLITGSTDIPGYEPTALSVSTKFYQQNVRAYIDWNNNGIFEEATETVIGASNGNNVPANSTLTVNVTPPPYAVKGTALRMRVIADYFNGVSITPCYTPVYGQVEDYAVTVIETISGCDGISEEITAEISQETAYVGDELSLQASGVLGSDGVLYQWQKSTDGITEWTNVTNLNTISGIVIAEGAIGENTFYRLKVTCLTSEEEHFSNVISYEIVPQYCMAGATSTQNHKIDNVTFAGINNNSASVSGYEDFTHIITDVQVGDMYAFSASYPGTTYGWDELFVWIDFNYDGDFDDEGELVLQTAGASPWTGNITIPENVSLGERRMRVRMHYNEPDSSFIPNNTPCGNSTLGQVEDYTVNITDLGCSGISDNIIASVVSGSGAENSQLILTAEGVQGVQGISYQWQKAINNTNDWQDIANANSKTLTTIIDTPAGNVVDYRLKVVCTETQTISYSQEITLPIYCEPSITDFVHESIATINVSDINFNYETYEDYYFSSSSIAGNFTAGETYIFNALDNYEYPQNEIKVWVDFNKNGSFEDEGELVLITSGTSLWTGNITIPNDAEAGITRMRVRMSFGSGGDSCESNTHGQTIDLMVNIHSIEGCTGISENIIASVSDPNGNQVKLTAQGVMGASQYISYQWQQKLEGTSVWENIENATTLSAIVSGEFGQTINYRLQVTCLETAMVHYSTTVSYLFVLNYCSAGANNATFESISNVTFADINNSSTGTQGYEDFTHITTDVHAGSIYPFSASFTGESYSSDQILVWIDFNNNGSFNDEGELVLQTANSPSPWTGNITIPENVSLGERRMRIRLHDTSYSPNNTPCGNSGYGQVEDYTITIFPNLSGVCSSTTTWNGTSWSNGNPDITKKAIINGVLVMNTDLSACELEVTENGKITIPADYTLTVKGQVINNATVADFIVANDAMLIQIDEAENQGAITVLKNSNPMKRLDYTLWSSPVEGMLLKNFSQVSASGGIGTIWNRVYTLGELAWDQVWNSFGEVEAGSDTFTEAKGYLYRSRNDYHSVDTVVFEGVFEGVPQNGTISIDAPLLFNAVGNPYPSPVDANQILTNGASALYFWTNTNAPDQSGTYQLNNWATYNYALGGVSADGVKTPDGVIQTAQGFVIGFETANPGRNVTFDNNMRVAAHNGQFFKSMNSERHRFWLNLSDESVTYNQILVGYVENATQGEDTGIDAQMFAYEGNAIYSLIENSDKQFVIQGRQLPFTAEDVVPIGFRAVNAGNFSISLNNFDGVFEQENTIIYLKDNFNQTQHNLSSGAYTFVSEEGIFNNRFEIIYQTTMSVENPDLQYSWIVFKQNSGFQIQTLGFELKEVQVYDMLGRKIYASEAEGTTHQTPDFMVDGVFIVKITSTENVILNKKVK